MGKWCWVLIVLSSAFTIGTLFAKDIVVCGTVADVPADGAPAAVSGAAALPCSVSVRAGCAGAYGDCYFAKTNTKGYYSLTASLPDNCTNNYQFVFNGRKQNRNIATVQLAILQGSAADTLRQNLQLTIIDEAIPSIIPDSIIADWKDQDGTDYAASIESIKTIYPAIANKITGTGEAGYIEACHWRRVARMKPYADKLESIMFCRHHNFGGIEVGYHDNSDAANADNEWTPKGALCLLMMENYYSTFAEIFRKDTAVVRDPCISFDGKRVVFAISGKGKGSGYKIYEMEIADTKTLRQLTFDPGMGTVVADFEPCYLPDGDIMFTSTRNFQLLSESYISTTNMFLMNGEGNYMRRVGFDQAHTFYPVVQNDGTVLYTRWEFNDRSMLSAMGLFVMNPDGCRQTEYFGNQNSWPLSIIHARPVPGSMKVMAVAGGNHGPYAGELMIIDRSKGANGSQSIQMIAPVRETKPAATKSDMAMGNVNFLFQNPCPLDENNFLVSWRKAESVKNYRLYFMNVDGGRELLAWSDQSVSQPVLVQPWKKIRGDEKPFMPKVQEDYTKTEGTFTMENVYGDPYCGLKKMDPIPQGAAKSLRVVEIGYRAQGAGSFGSVMGAPPTGQFGPAIFCPISTFGCSWDAKRVLGEAKIYDDGSANFKVPARTPVYFQVLNEKGYCIATMRSWSTLMPGETFSCFGCHENKTSAPPTMGVTQAMRNPPTVLEKPLGVEGTWFDFKKVVAPILDKNCASCHTSSSHASGFDMRNTDASGPNRTWTTSYNSLTKGLNNKSSNNAINIGYIFQKSEPEPFGSFGSTKSGMIANIDTGHQDVNLHDTDRKIIACWIDLCAPHGGYYSDYLTRTGYDKLEEKRTKWAAIEKSNIEAFLADPKTGISPISRDGSKTTGGVPRRCSMRYIPQQRALLLTHPDRGIFMLVDLRGRVIFHREITDRHIDNVSISLPRSLSRGCYAARFVGEGLTLQRMVSILR